MSAPPTQVTLAPFCVWKPVTTPSWLPAQRPSPPFSAESTIESAEPPSTSDAKLWAGACRMGTNKGLFPRAWGTPENHIGAKFLLRMLVASCFVGVIGMRDAGSSRFGKYEIRGVPGGGRMSENSGARDDKAVCFEESASMRFVLSLVRATRDWGVMSFGRSGK